MTFDITGHEKCKDKLQSQILRIFQTAILHFMTPSISNYFYHFRFGLVGELTANNEHKFVKPLIIAYYNIDWKRNLKGMFDNFERDIVNWNDQSPISQNVKPLLISEWSYACKWYAFSAFSKGLFEMHSSSKFRQNCEITPWRIPDYCGVGSGCRQNRAMWKCLQGLNYRLWK